MVELQQGAPPALVEQLADRAIRNGRFTGTCVIQALKTIPYQDSVPQLIRIIEESRSIVLKKAILPHLAASRDRRAVVPIAKLLRSPHSTLRLEAAQSLSDNRDDRIYPIVIGMIDDPNPVYRIYAAEALSWLYDQRFYQVMTRLLKDENKSVRIYAIRAVARNNLDNLLYMVRGAASGDDNDEVRAEALKALGEMRDGRGVYIMNRALSSGSEEVRKQAVLAIQKLGSSSSVYAVSSALDRESDPEIKDLMVETIIQLGKVGDMDGLEKIARHDPTVTRRIRAVHALGVVSDSRSTSILKDLLRDKNYRIRAEACNSLGMYQTGDTIHTLLGVIERDNKRYVKSAALYALKRMRSRSTIIPLLDLYYREKDPVFRFQMHRVVRYLVGIYT
jgi:HEAT repeat protein